MYILPLPTPTNHAYATNHGRWYKVPKVKAWENEVLWKLKDPKRKPITGNVSLSITFYVARPRDIDGGIKPLMDVLQKAGIYKNDTQVTELSVYKTTDKKNPRVELEVMEI